MLITPPPLSEEERKAYAQSLHGEEIGVRSINLWSKMQETEGWQKKFLSVGCFHQEVINEAGLSAEEMLYDFPYHSKIDGKNPEKAFQQNCL